MLRDVLAALRDSSAIDALVVVTAGGVAIELARDQVATVLRDNEKGHNAAAQLGIAAAIEAGADRVLLVPGDCPALDPDELDALLARPVDPPSVLIVPDRHGTGTNALALTPPGAMEPSFGPGSCRRHKQNALAAGAHAEVVEVPSLALDVDTPDDLEALEAALRASTGTAPRTRELLGKLTVSPKC
jgi:2-phospho-L-lactate guanylyltransferase